MKILIIGAGATGLTLGYFLRQAGAEITFLVKEKYEAKLKEGVTLHYHHTFKKTPDTFIFRDYDVRSQISDCAGKNFEAIFSTVPSNALQEGNWLKELGEALPGVTFVSFQPGLEDRNLILEKMNLSPENLLESSIPFLSYLAPMPGEAHLNSGTAFWFPPFSNGFFNGESGRAMKLVNLLKEAKYPAKYAPKYKENQLPISTALTILVTGLEKADWSFDKLFNSDKLYIVSKAVEEAYPLVHEKVLGVQAKSSYFRDLLFKGFTLKFILKMMQLLAPFDLEQFFQIHYTKIDTQRKKEFEAIISLKPRESLGTSLTLLRSKI